MAGSAGEPTRGAPAGCGGGREESESGVATGARGGPARRPDPQGDYGAPLNLAPAARARGGGWSIPPPPPPHDPQEVKHYIPRRTPGGADLFRNRPMKDRIDAGRQIRLRPRPTSCGRPWRTFARRARSRLFAATRLVRTHGWGAAMTRDFSPGAVSPDQGLSAEYWLSREPRGEFRAARPNVSSRLKCHFPDASARL